MITETWLNGNHHDNTTVAEILNTLKDFDFHHVPQANRKGGGVGLFLHKGFNVSMMNDWHQLVSFECLELVISHGSSSARISTI